MVFIFAVFEIWRMFIENDFRIDFVFKQPGWSDPNANGRIVGDETGGLVPA